MERLRTLLVREEKRSQTTQKYLRDLHKLMEFVKEQPITKEALIQYKEFLEQCGKYKASSINSYLVAANQFCEAMGWTELCVKTIKIQKEVFSSENQELTEQDYERLVQAAMKNGDKRLALIIQTLGSTGIRISELQYITVSTLQTGIAEIYNKGKIRRILYPSSLLAILQEYVKKEKLDSGSIFCTRTGRPLDRSNLWRAMKKLCRITGVEEKKVFPHNIRHLFARGFYRLEHDIAKLADVLGHSSIETTRIYIKTTGREHKKQLDRMKMGVLKTLVWEEEQEGEKRKGKNRKAGVLKEKCMESMKCNTEKRCRQANPAVEKSEREVSEKNIRKRNFGAGGGKK